MILVRSALAGAYAMYLAVVAYLVFTPGGTSVGGPIAAVLDAVRSLGIAASRAQVELGLNVVLFVPLSLLGWFVLHRTRVVFWVAVGAGLAVLIEVVQLAIPGRVSTVQDIVANTAGATIGAFLALGWASWGKRVR
ncbi:MAG TPA: VanZ family protein [Nocardioidaceae bacterium]|nr:VanZ family protein [Nocardioidaceae bacterium]